MRAKIEALRREVGENFERLTTDILLELFERLEMTGRFSGGNHRPQHGGHERTDGSHFLDCHCPTRGHHGGRYGDQCGRNHPYGPCGTIDGCGHGIDDSGVARRAHHLSTYTASRRRFAQRSAATF